MATRTGRYEHILERYEHVLGRVVFVLVSSGGGIIIQICSEGNKHPCLGWAVKMQWGDD